MMKFKKIIAPKDSEKRVTAIFTIFHLGIYRLEMASNLGRRKYSIILKLVQNIFQHI